MHPAVPRISNENPSGVDFGSVFERHLADVVANPLEASVFSLVAEAFPRLKIPPIVALSNRMLVERTQRPGSISFKSCSE